MITVLKRKVRIVIKSDSSGFSLIEVIVSILILSILFMGLIHYQQKIIDQHQRVARLLKAERVAFQLLDSYPSITDAIVPATWEYTLFVTAYTKQCNWVKIHITTERKESVEQKRLFC